MNGAYGEIKKVGINRAILAHFGGTMRLIPVLLRENSHVRAIRCMADIEAATATLVLRHNVSPRSAPPGISHASAS